MNKENNMVKSLKKHSMIIPNEYDDKHTHRFWECECCGLLITTLKQDNVTKYQCPACKISGCEHGGKFIEITLQDFCKNANINCI